MKYFGGCDVGSTYTKTVILDENGAIVAANTIKSKINSAQSAKAGLDQAIADAGLPPVPDLRRNELHVERVARGPRPGREPPGARTGARLALAHRTARLLRREEPRGG